MVTQTDTSIIEDYELEAVPQNKRRSLASITLVWYGFLITPAALFVGSTIAAGSTFGQFVVVVVIGMLLAAGFATVTGLVGQELGLSTYLLFRRFFGYGGSKLPGAIVYLTRVGWTALEVSIAAAIVNVAFDLPISTEVLAAVLALVFVMTAILGYTGLDYLSKVSVPLMLLAFLAAAYIVIQGEGWGAITGYTPEQPMPFSVQVSIALSSWVAGATLVSDIVRYAKDARDVTIANFAALVPGVTFLYALAGVIAHATGAQNPAFSVTSILTGWLFMLGFAALFLGSWTTSDNQYYSAGLAFSEMTNRKKAPLLVLTGVLTAIIAYGGIAQNLQSYLELVGIAIPPIVGVFLADYYILGLRYPSVAENIENIDVAFNPAAVGAWIVGAIIGYLTPILYIPPLTALAASTVTYVVLYKLDVHEPPVSDAASGRVDGDDVARRRPT